MFDELRSLFEESTKKIPVPSPSISGVRRRSRRTRITRVAVGAALAVSAVTAVGVFIRSTEQDRPVQAAGDSRVDGVDVDEAAHVVMEELGPHCRNFDFHFKSEILGQPYRPVQCGGRSETVPGSSAPEVASVRGPTLVLYSFATEAGREAWSEDHAGLWVGRLTGPRWIVDVLDRSVFGNIKARLGEQTLQVAEPPATWRLGRHSMQPSPADLTPAVSLQEAAQELTQHDEELWGAQLGLYQDSKRPRVEPVPAWLITVRSCVPSYGGKHAAPSCQGDRLHVIVDATTGTHIASFRD